MFLTTSETLIVLLLALPVVGFVLVVGVCVVLATRRPSAPRSPEAVREAVVVAMARGAGALVGLVLAVLASQLGSFGVGVMLAPALFGLCVLAGTAFGETVMRPRRPAGPRSASLTPRRVRDYLPPGLSVVVGLATLTGLAVLALTTATASTDPALGGARQLACRAADHGSSHGPYPGGYYSGPLALGLVVVAAVALLAARQVVRRPRGLVPDPSHDDALRRRSLDVVVAATGLAVSAPMAGVFLFAGSAMRSLATARPSCAAGWMGPVGAVLLLGAVAHLVVGLVCVVRLLVSPAAPVPARAQSLAS